MGDPVPAVVGQIVEKLRDFFSPTQEHPPTGGGTELIHVVAGEFAIPPAWDHEDCSQCGDPYIWVRVQSRFRTRNFPAPAEITGCDSRAATIEAGVARCAPADELSPDELETQAMVQWDDAWRLDLALCAATGAARQSGVALNTVLGMGEPYGPEGLVIAWLQTVTAQFR